jgi:hypothetical protein
LYQRQLDGESVAAIYGKRVPMSKHTAIWSKQVSKQVLEAALNYLSLQLPTAKAQKAVTQARRIPPVQRIAKDVLRASRLPLLPSDERHVAEDLKRIRKGKALSPVILVQGDLSKGCPAIIADGYHRMCAACHADEDSPVAIVLIPMR